MHYTPRTFTIPSLSGISEESIKLHLGLYEGYVKHVNLIQEKIVAYSTDIANNSYAIAEMQRRLGFEFGGMKNHEYYFAQFEDGARVLPEGTLKSMIIQQWGSVEAWQERFVQIAMTRGVGWAMMYFDQSSNQLVCTWVDEQHLGQLPDMRIVLALDMWEHSYMRDYLPAQKTEYVEAFFNNLNWEVVSGRVG